MNTNIEQMTARCPSAVCLGAAHIDNYELVFRTHADIDTAFGKKCWGVLWEITHDDLAALDILEGFPKYYVRIGVKAHYRDHIANAIAYQMTYVRPEETPYQGYLDMVTDGYQANNIPLSQIEAALNSVKTVDA